MANSNDKESILKDVYIISKDRRNSRPYAGIEPTLYQEWNPPKPKASALIVTNWFGLQGIIYDQYGEEMEVEIQFSIEGKNAKIEDNKIIEDVVDTDTSYFIVAKYGNLEKRQERFLYAPVEPPVSEVEIFETKLKASTDRQDFLEELIAEMAMMLYE